MTHYFKATDGVSTVYRASETRYFRAASFATSPTGDITQLSFSGRWYPACARTVFYAAEQITKAQYVALVAARNGWLTANGMDPRQYNKLSDGWVVNAALQSA